MSIHLQKRAGTTLQLAKNVEEVFLNRGFFRQMSVILELSNLQTDTSLGQLSRSVIPLGLLNPGSPETMHET